MVSNLAAKKVVLAITGGIAAYKSAELCRLLIKAGADVRVVMTEGAQAFIAPLTFQALSGNPVHTELLDPDAEAGMGHIELAKWPDLIIVAPASADFIARYAAGMGNDLLCTILLATDAQVCVAPAMNQQMYRNPLTQRNLAALNEALGNKIEFLGPQDGEQACGDVGPGRMMEPEQIMDAIERASVQENMSLMGKRIVITAGPTREALDPVRYISNHSSGKMGFALASQCRAQGADVVLIAGPVSLATPTGLQRIDVESAQNMYDAVMEQIEQGCDVFIASAAVADYRPQILASQKMKKTGKDLSIELCQNPDIVASVAKLDRKPFTVGFAAETNDVIDYAKGKLEKKNLNMIVANDVSQPGIGFNSDDNEVHVITSESISTLSKASKDSIALSIVKAIIERIGS